MKSVREQGVFDPAIVDQQLLRITAEIDGAADGPDLIGQQYVRLLPQRDSKDR